MKKLIPIFAISLTAVLAVNLAACNTAGKSRVLGAPKKATSLDYFEEHTKGLESLRDSVDAFSSEFSAAAYARYQEETNFTVSPLSAYMALSMAAACAGGNTRAELLSALHTTYEALTAEFPNLYRSVGARAESGKMGEVKLGNSIWLQEGVPFKEDCVQLLADSFYGYSYAADFMGDNKNANLAVRDFVKTQTKGLIDRDFKLSPATVFTIISTLYLKDTWNLYGDNLSFTGENYTFTEKNGTEKSLKLLEGYYNRGRAYDGEAFTSFFTTTYHNFRLKFFLPKEGYTVDDVFTAENIAEVNAVADYNADDDVNLIHYYTRCLFPEYKASYDDEMDNVLEDIGIHDLLNAECDFSALTSEKIICGGVHHTTTLTVNKKGIEGAAVFIIPGAGAAGPDGYTTVYEDFVLDRAFGFILTDYYNVPLFTGVVGKV